MVEGERGEDEGLLGRVKWGDGRGVYGGNGWVSNGDGGNGDDIVFGGIGYIRWWEWLWWWWLVDWEER